MNQTEDYQKKDLQRGVDYIGVCCVFFCHDGQGNLVMHKRSDECRDEQGRWDCGSGSMEFGESFEDGVRREILEEYAVEPKELKLCGVRNVIREHNGQPTHWIAVVFAALVDRDCVKMNEPEKMDDLNWFRIDNLPDTLNSQFLTHLEFVKNVIYI